MAGLGLPETSGPQCACGTFCKHTHFPEGTAEAPLAMLLPHGELTHLQLPFLPGEAPCPVAEAAHPGLEGVLLGRILGQGLGLPAGEREGRVRPGVPAPHAGQHVHVRGEGHAVAAQERIAEAGPLGAELPQRGQRRARVERLRGVPAREAQARVEAGVGRGGGGGEGALGLAAALRVAPGAVVPGRLGAQGAALAGARARGRGRGARAGRRGRPGAAAGGRVAQQAHRPARGLRLLRGRLGVAGAPAVELHPQAPVQLPQRLDEHPGAPPVLAGRRGGRAVLAPVAAEQVPVAVPGRRVGLRPLLPRAAEPVLGGEGRGAQEVASSGPDGPGLGVGTAFGAFAGGAPESRGGGVRLAALEVGKAAAGQGPGLVARAAAAAPVGPSVQGLVVFGVDAADFQRARLLLGTGGDRMVF